jgi:hypothetical protein
MHAGRSHIAATGALPIVALRIRVRVLSAVRGCETLLYRIGGEKLSDTSDRRGFGFVVESLK